MNGEDIDPHRCLFINPDIENLHDLLRELSQPEYNTDTGKLKITKQPTLEVVANRRRRTVTTRSCSRFRPMCVVGAAWCASGLVRR